MEKFAEVSYSTLLSSKDLRRFQSAATELSISSIHRALNSL